MMFTKSSDADPNRSIDAEPDPIFRFDADPKSDSRHVSIKVMLIGDGAATKRWILQHLHHETVLAQKGGFQNKCAK
jgi:hypothetical protein